MSQARVVVLRETSLGKNGDWKLCFQYCRYEFADNTEEVGYRFIWRRPDNSLQGARGQARIPSVSDMMKLVSQAMKEGWGHHIEENRSIS